MPEMKLIDGDRVIGIIRAEQRLIDGLFVDSEPCDNPGHCSLGALLAAAGVSDNDLRNSYIGEPVEWKSDSETAWVCEKMFDTYGIRPRHAAAIMRANDSCPSGTYEERRLNVLSRVHNLIDYQANEPDADARFCDYFDATSLFAEDDLVGQGR